MKNPGLRRDCPKEEHKEKRLKKRVRQDAPNSQKLHDFLKRY